MTEPAPPITVRSMFWPAFVPQGLFSIGLGAITPVIPLSATALGASPAGAAAVTAMIGVGQLVADAPAGSLTARFGERAVMTVAAIVVAASLAVAAFAPSIPALAVAIFVIGMANSVWILARITFVADRVPFQLRARAMSSLGGSQRVGFFVGPFAGAGMIHLMGTAGAYVLGLVTTALAAAVLIGAKEPGGASGRVETGGAAGYVALLRSQRRVFATVGSGILLLSIARASRQVVLPLWGEHISLGAAAISLIFGASGAMETLLFYPAGRLMDLRGRGSVAVGSMVGLGVAHLLLPLSSTTVLFTIVALLMGASNGIGSGLVMTLGADFAPPDQRPVFFGIWRLFSDVGTGSGPFLLAAITAALSLGAGVLVMGGVGFAAAAALGRWLPRRAPQP